MLSMGGGGTGMSDKLLSKVGESGIDVISELTVGDIPGADVEFPTGGGPGMLAEFFMGGGPGMDSDIPGE